MNRQEALLFLDECRQWFEPYTGVPEKWHEAIDIAIKALQGDMYCPSCGVRLVSENEYVEPKPFEGESEEV